MTTELKDEELVLQKTGDTYRYCRSNHAQNQALSDKLKNLYEAKQCLILPSGMASISACLNGLLIAHSKENVNIYASTELYCDTPVLLNLLKSIHSNLKNLYKIDVVESSKIVQLFTANNNQEMFVNATDKNQVNILFIESCTNPHGYVFDFDLLTILKKLSKKLIVVVDNTWLSSVSFNPLKHGADIAVTSLTKYYSGGNAIGGAILTDSSYFDSILTYACCNGLHVSPLNAEIIVKNIVDLEERIIRSSVLTKEIIEKFSERLSFIHPMLENHPSHALAKKYFKYWPSVLVMVVNSSKNSVVKLMSTNSYIEYKTSFGSTRSRFDNFPKVIEGKIHCRLAIGHSDKETLQQGLEEFISKLENQNQNQKQPIKTTNKNNQHKNI